MEMNGAPNKNTVGDVGDVYLNTITNDRYKCVAIYTIESDKKITLEYDWILISGQNDARLDALEARIQELELEIRSIVPIVGTVNEDNTITIYDTLEPGIYTLEYEFKDGTQEELEEFTIITEVSN